MDPFIGEIRIFAGTFAPSGWALCNGQIMSITQNTALFSLLGTTYGGDGISTFALPNLQGRVPIHMGQLQGGSSYVQGEASGTENVTLGITQMPQHTHAMYANGGVSTGSLATPVGNYLANTSAGRGGGGINIYASSNDGSITAPSTISGSSQPHSNMQPFLVLNFIIALQGIYPSRS